MTEPFLSRLRSAIMVSLTVGALAAAMAWGQSLPVPGEGVMAQTGAASRH